MRMSKLSIINQLINLQNIDVTRWPLEALQSTTLSSSSTQHIWEHKTCNL